MKPAYILLLILIFTFKFSLFSQNIDIIITPKKYPGWSGSVRNIDGKYNKFDGSIKIGKGSFYSFFRGYAVFDVSKIPDDADIKSIKLHLITKDPSQFFIRKILKFNV